MTGTRQPKLLDRHVGERIRARRKALKIKLDVLAGCMELTVRQLQKYEAGRNRISASKLHEISKQLNVPVAYFFHGYDCVDDPGEFDEEAGEMALQAFLLPIERSEVTKAFARIKSVGRRAKMLQLICALGDAE